MKATAAGWVTAAMLGLWGAAAPAMAQPEPPAENPRPEATEEPGTGMGTEMKYEDGDPLPPGYRLVVRPRLGLVIVSAVVTASLWAASLSGAVASKFGDHSGWLLVPGIGPWLMLLTGGTRSHCHQKVVPELSAPITSCDGGHPTLRTLLILDGIGQTAGAIALIAGLASPIKVLIEEGASVSVLPTRVGRDGYGLGVVGAF